MELINNKYITDAILLEYELQYKMSFKSSLK